VSSQTLIPPARPPESPGRRLKPGARRKLAVILGGTLAGGVVAFVVEAAGIPAQLASTLGGAVTAVVAATDELRERRSEPHEERLRRLVNGDVYRNPLLIGFYVALAAFLATNLVALPGSITSYLTLVLGGYSVSDLEFWDPHVIQAVMFVDIPLTFVYMVPIAVMATHRLRRHAFVYISTAIVAMVALGTAIALVWDGMTYGAFTETGLIIISAVSLVAALPAIAIGTAWAHRTQDAFAMRKLFAQLDQSDKSDLIELVKTLPRAREA
jgi:hypothetical protein